MSSSPLGSVTVAREASTEGDTRGLERKLGSRTCMVRGIGGRGRG